MSPLPARLRAIAPTALRDEVHLRALAVAGGLIPPRRMHSDEDVGLLLDVAGRADRVVEIGVYEGSSAVALCGVMAPRSELHLIDPFGAHPDALPGGWGATEWATRRVIARELAGLPGGGPEVRWHIALSHAVAVRWSQPVDVVFIDGDHSEDGCERDWCDWHPFVRPGGHIVFHDARAGQAGGRGLPGPTAVVDRYLRGADGITEGWRIVGEADRTILAKRTD